MHLNVDFYKLTRHFFKWLHNFCFIFFLQDHIARYGKMSERTARQKFWQIISAVDYCHRNNIVHRDLKVIVTNHKVVDKFQELFIRLI